LTTVPDERNLASHRQEAIYVAALDSASFGVYRGSRDRLQRSGGRSVGCRNNGIANRIRVTVLNFTE